MQLAWRAGRWMRSRLRRAMFRPRIRLHPTNERLVTLGRGSYGSWSFVDTGRLFGSTIISAGLGEDASFEVSFAAKYQAKVIIVDPTPRAIKHFDAIVARLGKPPQRAFPERGAIPVDAYDLRSLAVDNFSLVAKALWHERTRLKFFAPSNRDNVSHSLVNLHHGADFIEVDTVALSDLIREHAMVAKELELLKLDIEGAETVVLNDILRRGICPRQIAVEYDEMAFPTREARERIEDTHEALTECGYSAIHYDGHETYLYWRR
jgi:FkbM family methyltransferase